MRAKLTADEKAEIIKLYRDGVPVKIISAEYGCDRTYPSALAKRAKLQLRMSDEARKRLGESTRRIFKEKARKAEDKAHAAAAKRKAIESLPQIVIELQPYDTRPFTAQFFGDPLPGRSALDQKRAAECQ